MLALAICERARYGLRMSKTIRWTWAEIDAALPAGVSMVPMLLASVAGPFGGLPASLTEAVDKMIAERKRVTFSVAVAGETPITVEIS